MAADKKVDLQNKGFHLLSRAWIIVGIVEGGAFQSDPKLMLLMFHQEFLELKPSKYLLLKAKDICISSESELEEILPLKRRLHNYQVIDNPENKKLCRLKAK